MASVTLIVLRNGQPSGTDISSLVESVTWKGRKGTPTRSVTATIIDDDGYRHARSGIDVEQGWQCVLSVDGREVFQGLIMSQTQTRDKKMQFTAYDMGIYLSNNKDTFCYENKTADQVFSDVCGRFGLPVGSVARCSYTIPELTKGKTSGWDAIADALSLDFDATGVRHFVRSEHGSLSLLERREDIRQWVIGAGENVTTYSYGRSIENVRTRFRLVSKEGATLAEATDAGMEERIGVFQEVEQADDSLTPAQANSMIESMMAESGTPERTLSVEAAGIADVVSGVGVYVVIPTLGLSKTFYVDEDTHTFEGRRHTMRLKLNSANDIDAPRKPAQQQAQQGGQAAKSGHSVGDIVQFAGGSHYVSSDAAKPASTGLSPGKAKITKQKEGAAHPWHLITESWAETHVWGWVDEGSFS